MGLGKDCQPYFLPNTQENVEFGTACATLLPMLIDIIEI